MNDQQTELLEEIAELRSTIAGIDGEIDDLKAERDQLIDDLWEAEQELATLEGGEQLPLFEESET